MENRICLGVSQMVSRRDHTEFWRVHELGGMEMLHATNTDPAHPRHMHATFTIGVVDHGTVVNQSRGETTYLPAGSVYVFNPGEVHSGCAADALHVSHRTFYPEEGALTTLAHELGLKGTPSFRQLMISDGRSVDSLRNLHQLLEMSESLLERQSTVVQVFGDLLRRHMLLRPTGQLRGYEPQAVREVRAYLDVHYRENVSLDTLASLVNLNRAYLIRVFRRTLGLPPYSYLIFRRVEAAKRLLRLDMPLAQVALEVGFSDQSHLNLHFTRLLNVTPGRYAKSHYLPRKTY